MEYANGNCELYAPGIDYTVNKYGKYTNEESHIIELRRRDIHNVIRNKLPYLLMKITDEMYELIDKL
jgi:hypothetical protein